MAKGLGRWTTARWHFPRRKPWEIETRWRTLLIYTEPFGMYWAWSWKLKVLVGPRFDCRWGIRFLWKHGPGTPTPAYRCGSYWYCLRRWQRRRKIKVGYPGFREAVLRRQAW